MNAILRRSIATACFLAPSVTSAQMPEKFTNLQVLPNDIPRGELIGIMRRFTSSLGLRCE